SHLSKEAKSMGDNFHWRTGSIWRIAKRVRCSFLVTENHSFVKEIPDPKSMFSNIGTSRRNSACCDSVQKPITLSTPERLYQERSKNTISPPAGKCLI